MRLILSLPVGLALAATAAPTAFAGTLTASTILSDFNAIIYNNGSTTSDIEGAAVIGGDFSGATVFNNPASMQAQPGGYGALTVFGNTSGNTINLDNSGNAYVGGTRGATISFNGGRYVSAPGNTIADFKTPMNALSATLAGLTATGALPTTANNEVIAATPGSNGIAVIDTTAALLDSISSFSINLGSASTLVINVSGTSVDFAANEENLPSVHTSAANVDNNVIWNFYQATSVSLPDQIGGTILATGANVANGNQIDGDLIANSWGPNAIVQNIGELHDWAFDGTLPSTSPAVPEPGSLSLIGAGLVGLIGIGGACRRWRRPSAAS